MKLDLVIPVWGQGYVERMLRYALPSLRAEGNLPALRLAFEDVRVRFYTPESNAADLLAAVRGDPGVEVVPVPDAVFAPGCHNGTVMRDLFQRGFTEAWNRGAAFAPVCADAVYSDGFFRSASNLVLAGKRAAMTQGSGVSMTHWLRMVGHLLEGGSPHVLALPPRDLMTWFIRETNHGQHLPTWPGTQLYPAQMFWKAGDHALVMRCCHMYTAILVPDRHDVMAYSHDNDLAELALNDPSSIGWMDDSDMGFFIGLAAEGNPCLEDAKPEGDTSLENFCRQWMSPWKAEYFQQYVLWHDGQANPTDVQQAVQASDEVIAHIMNVYRSVHGQ